MNRTTQNETPNKKLGLWEKIWTIQTQIPSLIKDEINKFQNYKYFDELQILQLVKPLLAKYRLALTISDDETQPFLHEREGTNHFIKYLKVLMIVDLDNREAKTFKFWACGNNTDLAKAKGSSETYAVKYILSKFFLIKVLDENDPERKKPVVKELTEAEQKQVKEIVERHNLKGFNSTYGK